MNKLAIWESLKIKCLTRCLVSIYAVSLLTLFIKIELNIIGAYLFMSNSSPECNKNEWSSEFIEQQANTLSNDVQQEFLNNIENFVSVGLTRLTSIVQAYCEEVFMPIGLKESLNVGQVSEKIKLIQEKIEADLFGSDKKDEDFFARFMLPNLNVRMLRISISFWIGFLILLFRSMMVNAT